MKNKYVFVFLGSILLGLIVLFSCENKEISNVFFSKVDKPEPIEIKVEAEESTGSSEVFEIITLDSTISYVKANVDGWITLDLNISVAGRYKSQIRAANESGEEVKCWIEDNYDNKDRQIYNLTGDLSLNHAGLKFSTLSKDGTPLNSGIHKLKVHFDHGVNIDWIKFTLIKKYATTPKTLKQNIKGTEWKLVWSDEFEQADIDSTKWSFDFGDWGWGNNEVQYYTKVRKVNARIEEGNLVIEARRNDMGHEWTSARLTTHGKVSFLYGRIEICAKVPSNKGNLAAAWTLGDEYVDELTWPDCGQIDILECVGYEMDDNTGNGVAHASAHAGSSYFKPANQAPGTIEVANMSSQYHTYAVEWLPDGIEVYADNQLYASYNNTSTDLSWPFSKPQNIILNLAMGGGWGGYYGIDQNVNSQKMIIDYVRVYELY